MKNYLILLFVMLTSLTSISQETFDIVLKTNGEEMVGTVNSLNEEEIIFTYKNETITYKVKLGEIVKITFSSGRVQFFNDFNTPNPSTTNNLEDHHNKVAVLPFAYIKDESNGSKAISERIQAETYALFNKHNGGLKYQDPRNTNALLVKAGVANNNINGYTMGEICNILGVEFVIQGTVSVQKTSQNSYSSSNTTTTKKSDAKVDKSGHLIGSIFGHDGKSKTSRSTSSTSVQNYGTSMIMNIYNDRGDNIFSQDHTSFWNTQDAYKITLKYLAKRTPLYKK